MEMTWNGTENEYLHNLNRYEIPHTGKQTNRKTSQPNTKRKFMGIRWMCYKFVHGTIDIRVSSFRIGQFWNAL